MNATETIATAKTRFVRRFDTRAEAIQFEESVLSIGRALLPECALAVLDGAEPTATYWAFMVEQSRCDPTTI